MEVIGLTSALRLEAERKCRGAFAAWLMEVRAARWTGEEDLQAAYPRAGRTAEESLHFPLRADGFGIRARILWSREPAVRLLDLGTAPAAAEPASRRISKARHQA